MSEAVRKAFIENPASQEIADELNGLRMQVETCIHRRNPRILRCGVQKEHLAGVRKWRVIPKEQRDRWLAGPPWEGRCDQHRSWRFTCGCVKETT